MDVDIGNALASVASPGVSRDSLDRLDDRVARAHDRIQAGREAGEHGYAALNLPDRTEPDAIRAAVEPVAGTGGREVEAIVTVGIGGSALGAATVVAALGGDLETVFLDNVDPAWVETR
ncbi:MAG: glucose-6-phosphate isomerase, partial [Phycisphaeraceae bacterium]